MSQPHRTVPAVASTVAVLFLAFVGVTLSSRGRLPAPAQTAAERIDNHRPVSASVISGGEPHGAPAFAALRRQGIRTIVSVDGARTDAAAARQHGLRYVHIPIGYDGLPDDALRRLTRVMRECDRPVFVHCHHGKHRGPAAAAICAIIAGELDNAAGLKFLEHAGTSREYAGLWRDVGRFQPLPADTPLPPLAETVDPPPLVDVMVQIDECFDQLAESVVLRQRGGNSISDRDRPIPGAIQLAATLHEHFREAARLGQGGTDGDLHRKMMSAEQSAQEIAKAARHCPTALPALIDHLQESCRSCHEQHRN